MNLYLLLGLVIAWGASVGGAFLYGTGVGEDSITARQVAVDKAINDTRKAAEEGAANAISKIKVVNTTIRQRAETVVRDNVRYVDCRHADGMRDTIDAALGGRPQPISPSKLPAADAPK